MDICLAFDDGYLPHAMVLIESILRANEEDRARIKLWILGIALKPQTLARLERNFGGRVAYEVLNDLKFDPSLSISSFAQHKRITASAMLRILIDSALPSSVSRVLYLDCDILCVGALRPLFETNIDRFALAAVRDPYASRFVDDKMMPGLEKYPHIDPQAAYFNSGVMLINRKMWRELSIESRCLKYLRDNADKLRFCDQDALNYAAYGAWKRLPVRWNHAKFWRLEPRLGGALEDASLVHFVGNYKIWYEEAIDGVIKQRYFELRSSSVE